MSTGSFNNFLGSSSNTTDYASETTLDKIYDQLNSGETDVNITNLSIPVSISTMTLTDVDFTTTQTELLGVDDVNSQAILTTIDADTSILSGAVSLAKVQCDIISIPAVTANIGTSGSLALESSGNLDIISGDTSNIDSLLTSIVKTEDTAHTTADKGIMSLAVRNDDLNNMIASEDGDYTPLTTNKDGCMRVELSENSIYNLGFGSLNTSELTPVLQYSFLYDVNPRIWETAISSGSVGIDSHHMKILGTALALANVSVTTERTLHYRNGQTAIFRTALYIAGDGTGADGSAGVNALQWGIASRNFGTDTKPNEGFMFSYGGGDFNISIRKDLATDAHTTSIPRASWNGEDMSAIDPEKGNVYQITYQWLGYGAIRFWIMDPTNHFFRLAHTYNITNTATTQSVAMPYLSAYYGVISSASAHSTDFDMRVSSVGLFISGKNIISYPPRAIAHSQSSVSVATHMISVRVLTTYESAINYLQAILREMTVACVNSQSNTSILKVYHDSTLSGASFTALESGVSILETDTSATITTPGRLVYSVGLSNDSAVTITLPYEMYIGAGHSWNFEITPSGGSVEVELGLMISEDF